MCAYIYVYRMNPVGCSVCEISLLIRKRLCYVIEVFSCNCEKCSHVMLSVRLFRIIIIQQCLGFFSSPRANNDKTIRPCIYRALAASWRHAVKWPAHVTPVNHAAFCWGGLFLPAHLTDEEADGLVGKCRILTRTPVARDWVLDHAASPRASPGALVGQWCFGRGWSLVSLLTCLHRVLRNASSHLFFPLFQWWQPPFLTFRAYILCGVSPDPPL